MRKKRYFSNVFVTCWALLWFLDYLIFLLAEYRVQLTITTFFWSFNSTKSFAMMWIAVLFLVNSSRGNLVKIITFQTHSKEEVFLCIWISFFCVCRNELCSGFSIVRGAGWQCTDTYIAGYTKIFSALFSTSIVCLTLSWVWNFYASNEIMRPFAFVH